MPSNYVRRIEINAIIIYFIDFVREMLYTRHRFKDTNCPLHYIMNVIYISSHRIIISTIGFVHLPNITIIGKVGGWGYMVNVNISDSTAVSREN